MLDLQQVALDLGGRINQPARQGTSYAVVTSDVLNNPALMMLSDSAFRALFKLAAWTAMWDYAGLFDEEIFADIVRVSKPKAKRILDEWSREVGRWGSVVVREGALLRINPKILSFARDGHDWDKSEIGKVLTRDGLRCRYCAVDLSPDLVTFDHIYPRSRGGSDKPGNLAVCCRSCNSRKNDRTPEEAGMLLLDTKPEQARWRA